MANIKITGYAELAAPISTDLVEVVSDPGGTPISKKAQIRNLFKGGGQIAFPATAVPSADPNTIDDYEEGEYTPTLTCGTSGTITLSASVNTLAYTKNGRKNTVTGYIGVDSVSSPLGSLTLSLPFSVANLSENSAYALSLVSYTGINALNVAGALHAVCVKNTSGMLIRESTTTSYLNDLANHIKANSILFFGFTYFTS